MPYWAALRTRVNCEKRVVACLSDLGFETYYPTVTVERRLRGRRIGFERPLLATYVFVFLAGEWRPIFQIGSAIGLVKSSAGSAPSAVPAAAMETLRERERTDVAEPGGLQIGSVVRVIQGPCTGQIASCLQVQHTFVTIILSFFGSERQVRVDRRYVEAL